MTASDRSSRPVWLGVEGRGWDHVRVHVDLLADWRLAPARDRCPDTCSKRCRCPSKAIVMAVYVGLAVHAELQTGAARPGAETLAEYAGCDERTVRDAIKVLTRYGWIAAEARPGKAHQYRLLRPPLVPERPRGGDPGCAQRAGHSPGHPGAVTRGTPGQRPDEQDPVTRSMNDAERASPEAVAAAVAAAKAGLGKSKAARSEEVPA